MSFAYFFQLLCVLFFSLTLCVRILFLQSLNKLSPNFKRGRERRGILGILGGRPIHESCLETFETVRVMCPLVDIPLHSLIARLFLASKCFEILLQGSLGLVSLSSYVNFSSVHVLTMSMQKKVCRNCKFSDSPWLYYRCIFDKNGSNT